MKTIDEILLEEILSEDEITEEVKWRIKEWENYPIRKQLIDLYGEVSKMPFYTTSEGLKKEYERSKICAYAISQNKNATERLKEDLKIEMYELYDFYFGNNEFHNTDDTVLNWFEQWIFDINFDLLDDEELKYMLTGKNFDLQRAINDEEYAREIIITNNGRTDIYYDDYIFIISSLYGSNIKLSLFRDKIIEKPIIFENLLRFATIIHCQNWEDAIVEIVDDFKLLEYLDLKSIKSFYDSRKWVKENITPKLLKKLKANNEILIEDVINALDIE